MKQSGSAMLTPLAALALFASIAWGVALANEVVIQNGRVIDPETGLDAIRNVAVEDGRIVAISEFPLKGDKVIDARGVELPARLALDGATSACDWGRDPDSPPGSNLYGYSALPKFVTADYAANSNNSYFRHLCLPIPSASSGPLRPSERACGSQLRQRPPSWGHP